MAYQSASKGNKGGVVVPKKASPNPAKAETRPNLKTTFGTPKKTK